MSTAGALRGWVRTRLGRRPVRLETPLAPALVASRLAASLAPMQRWRSPLAAIGWATAPVYEGSVRGWWVRARCRARSSWVWQFEGAIYARDDGTVLAGTVGLTTYAAAFSRIWVAGVGLFLLAGVIGTLGELTTGHAPSYAPLAIVPLVMLAFFVVMTEVGYRTAASAWRGLAEWLQSTLEAPRGWIDEP